MKLIDADKLIYEDIDCTDGNTYMVVHAPMIDAQPTAYDADKVVEQLEDLKSHVPVNRVLDDITNDKLKELGMLIAYGKAIEIVKRGGCNDD